ncbi:hypothetical protein BX281_2890 [Streptomyces sp. Ag82_O1-15]|jgi:hypothetical protein|uniref:hypothetical protein n=1 Tax=Streptomyces sp. Ag82_O1-15 TaxID=1938855 RepID=UPI000BDDEE91|nr:hypothetical protein [Streptomyces sp. Ag82_O1-15]PBC94962.1 hypothetical protein BX281_2890 [Streptomyces sp. Ag82_O1-15]
MFDATGEALCRAAAIRLGGALRVLAARAGLSERYETVAAGVGHLAACLDGGELDVEVLGSAFAANWNLSEMYPAELPGREFFRVGLKIVFVVLVLTRPDQQVAPAQGLEFALNAADAWPSEVRIDSFTRLADFELACQVEAEDRLITAGLSALRELAEAQADQYRRAAASLVG